MMRVRPEHFAPLHARRDAARRTAKTFGRDIPRAQIKGLEQVQVFLRIGKLYAIEKAEWPELAEHLGELIGDCNKRIIQILRRHPPRPGMGEAIGERDYPAESIKATGGRLVLNRKEKRR